MSYSKQAVLSDEHLAVLPDKEQLCEKVLAFQTEIEKLEALIKTESSKGSSLAILVLEWARDYWISMRDAARRLLDHAWCENQGHDLTWWEYRNYIPAQGHAVIKDKGERQ